MKKRKRIIFSYHTIPVIADENARTLFSIDTVEVKDDVFPDVSKSVLYKLLEDLIIRMRRE